MKKHQKVGLSFLAPLLIILFLSGNATADTYSFSVGSTLGDRDTFNFTVNSVGTINAGATWTGTAANLALILNGPVQVGYYARDDGPSPLSLNYTVTSADLSKGSGWTLSIVNFRGGDATGTATITYPTNPTPASGVTTPSGPQKLKASTGDGYVALDWSPPSDDGSSAITEYKIYRGTSSGGESYHASVSTTSYNDTTVTNGQTYYYYVAAVNVAGESGPSNEVPAETQGPPGSPQNVMAEAGYGFVTLEWIAPSDDGGSEIINYNIYRDTTPGGETLLKTVGNVLIYTDGDVTSYQIYYYQVSAVNSVGEGEKSNEVAAAAKPMRQELESAITITTPTPTPTPSVHELIDDAFKKLSSGQILFNPPEKMKVGIEERVEVRLTKDITENLTEELKGPGAPQIESIKVGTCMMVKLTGDSFDINALSSEEQVVKPVGFTEWSWDVTPLKSGRQELHLTVIVRILIPGQDEQKIDWLVKDKQINIEVNPSYTFKRFIECHWQWIVGTIISAIAVIPIILKLSGRTRKR